MDTPLQEVVFCIFEDHNAGKWHNPRGNMEPFRDVFGIPRQHVRFSAGTKAPAADDAPQAKPKGAC
eukprot:12352493-Alexandrium_andersonii.AAC.1